MQYIISEKPQKHLGQRTKLQELNSMKHGSNGKLTKALASVMLNMWWVLVFMDYCTIHHPSLCT
uniref:Ovule protein n=1 Tax=Heterorhabditis bacteriophora TaxID=37862 RepID=A0A1I7WQJ3_HETBA